MGILYALVGLIIAPIFLLLALMGHAAGGAGGMPAAFGGVFMAILLPVFYWVVGCIGDVISAALYNLIAKFTGGLEFEVKDVALTM